MAAVPLTELRPLPPELKIEAHLVELESMGYTVVDDAIPPRRSSACRRTTAR